MKKSLISLVGLVAAFVTFSGCAATAASGGGGSPDRVTYADLQSLSSNNLYEALQQIRPTWLRTRGVSSFSGEADPIVVYVDNVRFGEVDALTSFRLDSIESVQRVSATNATQRYGTGHAGGALVVVTRRGS